MCGIIGYVGKDNGLQVLIDGLKSLEYRGYDSSGVAYFKNKKVNIIKTNGKVSDLEKILSMSEKVNIGIAHTRWATHGKPNEINAHPHTVGKITLVHNGIIENYNKLKENLIKEGYTFISQTDTEILTALIDKYYKLEGDVVAALDKIKNIVKGSYAIAVICSDNTDTIYAIRNGSPLIVGIDDNRFYIASDVPAILKYTNKYILLNDNEIVKLNNELTIYDTLLNVTLKDINIFEGNIECAEKNNFEHFMLKEIHEQDEVIKKTMFPYVENGLDFKSMPDFSEYNNIHIVACGSAYHAGLIGKSLIEKYANIKCDVEIASEYRYKKLFYNNKTLLIVVSQSGETADTLASLRLAKNANIDTLAIVNVVGSSIARESKYVIYTKAGYEIAVATTKALMSQLSIFSLIAFNIGIKKNIIDKKTSELIINDIFNLPKNLNNFINKDHKKIAKKLYKHEHVFFIGRLIDYPLAMEGSLKLKEISYIHSEAYAAGELKHGTISLICDKTPVIGIITDNDILEKTISNIKEVKARGANTFLIITNNLNGNFDMIDNKIIIPSVHELLQPILTLLPLQLISYEIAKMRGCDIDKPKNLAKSVTVE